MEITREQITMLEKRVEEIEKSLSQEVLPLLEQISKSVQTIEQGLYGDEKNDTHGLVKRVNALEETVKQMEKDRQLREATASAKINVWKLILEIFKWGSLIFLVVRGILSVDVLWGNHIGI